MEVEGGGMNPIGLLWTVALFAGAAALVRPRREPPGGVRRRRPRPKPPEPVEAAPTRNSVRTGLVVKQVSRCSRAGWAKKGR